MKATILSIVCVLFLTFVSRAQMDDVMDKYFKCMSDCRTGKGGSSDAEIVQCKQICYDQTKCPKASAKVLTEAVNLTSLIGVKNGSNNIVPIFQDKTYQYFAVYKDGKLQGYQLKNKAGVTMPFPLVSYMLNGKKQYFIFDITGKYLEVKAPDIVGIEIKGKAL